MSSIVMQFGRQAATFNVADDAIVAHVSPDVTSSQSPEEMMRAALDAPMGHPPLRLALTPDDRITVVVDERLPHLVKLLVPILEVLVEAGIKPEAVTLLCPPPAGRQLWLNDLPDAFDEVQCEVHHPDRSQDISYLSSTKGGRRLYFNRRLVDADQVISLSSARFDPIHGYSGGVGSLYPALCGDETLSEITAMPTLEVPTAPWPLQEEAVEAVWCLGAPFFIQVIEGQGDSIAQICAGATEMLGNAREILTGASRIAVPRLADTVVVGLGGDPGLQTFEVLADALSCASRAVGPRGRIILLTEAAPELSEPMRRVCEMAEPDEVLRRIKEAEGFALRAAWQWATVADQAELFILSGWEDSTVEDLHALPVDSPLQVQRLIDAGKSCLFINDAHKQMVVIE